MGDVQSSSTLLMSLEKGVDRNMEPRRERGKEPTCM